jgi:hypothetical protein
MPADKVLQVPAPLANNFQITCGSGRVFHIDCGANAQDAGPAAGSRGPPIAVTANCREKSVSCTSILNGCLGGKFKERKLSGPGGKSSQGNVRKRTTQLGPLPCPPQLRTHSRHGSQGAPQ